MAEALQETLRRFQSAAVRQSGAMDDLVRRAVFGAADEREQARWLIWEIGQRGGVRPASIHELYMARGRGEAPAFTTPAINVRVLAYDSGRAIFRAAKRLDVGAVICEIARSEIAYTDQRPAEYVAVMTAAALREGFQGPRRPRAQGLHGRLRADAQATRCGGGHQQDLGADGHEPRRRGAAGRLDRQGAARPRRPEGALHRCAQDLPAGWGGAAWGLHAAPRRLRALPEVRGDRDSSRDQLPEHRLRSSEAAGRRAEGAQRVGQGRVQGGVEEGGHRGAIHIQESQEGDRALQAAPVGPAGRDAHRYRRRPGEDVQLPARAVAGGGHTGADRPFRQAAAAVACRAAGSGRGGARRRRGGRMNERSGGGGGGGGGSGGGPFLLGVAIGPAPGLPFAPRPGTETPPQPLRRGAHPP